MNDPERRDEEPRIAAERIAENAAEVLVRSHHGPHRKPSIGWAVLMGGVAMLAPSIARADAFAIGAEPGAIAVATVDGSVGPSLVIEGGYELEPTEWFRAAPLLRLGAAYAGDAAPLTAAAAARVAFRPAPLVVSLTGFLGAGDAGQVATHGVQPLYGGGLAVEGEATTSIRLGAFVTGSALVGDKSTAWVTFGPRLLVSIR